MMWGYGMGFAWGWLWLALLLVVAIAALVVLIVWLATRRGTPGAGSPARRILEERLARGEISPEEFAERVRALESR